MSLFVGIATENPSPIPRRFDRLPIEASEWVIFATVGSHPTATQNTWARIGTEWFPTSGYEMTGGSEIL